MEQNTKKPTADETLIQLLHHINSDNRDLFYQVIEDYIGTLARGGKYYYRLANLLKEKPLKLRQLKELPGEISKLLRLSDITDENVFLNGPTKALLDELLLEWRNVEVYKCHNLGVRNKILLHGPTGNGKTTIAKHIARLIELPFIEVNADSIIDSHLGNTGFNIYKIFNQVKEPCVLFWDEIDTIGRKRSIGGDSAASLENERMVNSILVNIEKLNGNVIFIGATNRREVLDSAFLRRFDVQFELTAPSPDDKLSFARKMTEYYKLPEEVIPLGILGMDSYSDIKLMIMDIARKYVVNTLKEKEVLTEPV